MRSLISNRIIIFLAAALPAVSCSNVEQGMLITVGGPVPVESMGTALVHEHVMVDFIGADSTGSHRWDRSEVVERVLPYLLEAKEQGVTVFFECTPAYLGRDPLLLKTLSERSGIHLVTNTGYYGARHNKYVPSEALAMTPGELAQIWISESENGIEGTGVFPGFIKIAVDRDASLSPVHEKIVRAAAIAHKATGLTIVSHTGPDEPALAQIEILKEEGVSPAAFVWTHAQGGTPEGYEKAAREGAWISLDHIRHTGSGNPDQPGRIGWYVETLTSLKEKGLIGQVLLSHDAGWYSVGEENGGDFRGYTELFEFLIPALRKQGFAPGDIEQLLVENPRRAYAVGVRTPGPD